MMTIRKINILDVPTDNHAANGFFVSDDAGIEQACFDNLDTAACVLRYLYGAGMPDADIEPKQATCMCEG